jgi:hypothetical protein
MVDEMKEEDDARRGLETSRILQRGETMRHGEHEMALFR